MLGRHLDHQVARTTSDEDSANIAPGSGTGVKLLNAIFWASNALLPVEIMYRYDKLVPGPKVPEGSVNLYPIE